MATDTDLAARVVVLEAVVAKLADPRIRRRAELVLERDRLGAGGCLPMFDGSRQGAHLAEWKIREEIAELDEALAADPLTMATAAGVEVP